MHPSVNHSIAHHTEVLAKITESPTTSLPPGLVELDVMGWGPSSCKRSYYVGHIDHSQCVGALFRSQTP